MLTKELENFSATNAAMEIVAHVLSYYVRSMNELGDKRYDGKYISVKGSNAHLVSPIGGVVNPKLKAETKKPSTRKRLRAEKEQKTRETTQQAIKKIRAKEQE
jgi:hypothetical protein